MIYNDVEAQRQLNLTDRAQSKDQNPKPASQGESSQPNATENSIEPPTNSEAGPSGVNEQQGNANENSAETQTPSFGPLVEEPTIGERAGLSPFDEGMVTNYLSKFFKRKGPRGRK